MPGMRPQWITLGVILLTTVLVIGYDVWAIRQYGTHASISHVLRSLFSSCPSLFVATVFWLGILIGHIFLPCE